MSVKMTRLALAWIALLLVLPPRLTAGEAAKAAPRGEVSLKDHARAASDIFVAEVIGRQPVPPAQSRAAKQKPFWTEFRVLSILKNEGAKTDKRAVLRIFQPAGSRMPEIGSTVFLFLSFDRRWAHLDPKASPLAWSQEKENFLRAEIDGGVRAEEQRESH